MSGNHSPESSQSILPPNEFCVCRVFAGVALTTIKSFDNLPSAKEHMKQIAARAPGSYVVFNKTSRQVVAEVVCPDAGSAGTRVLADNECMAGKLQTPVKVRVERPRARRFSFVAKVELFDLQSEIHFQGRITDLSLYGCGVTAIKALPTGTKLRVRITSKGPAFSALGRVAYATSDGDIGIVFTRTEPNDQSILEKWISELR